MGKPKMLLIFLSLGVIASCGESDVPPSSSLKPKSEIHFNFETAEKLGEKILTYDARGNLTLEVYTDIRPSVDDKETKYTYDASGNLTEKAVKEPGTSDYFFMRYVYENNLLKSETQSWNETPQGYQTLYYYSGTRLDSTRFYYYSTLNNGYVYLQTTLYQYDEDNRMTKAFEKGRDGATLYRYNGKNLIETCNLLPDFGSTQEACIKNVYDSQGRLMRIESTSPWRNELQEEFFYQGNRLHEKKIYTYPAYDPGNTEDILLIRYIY